MKAEPARTTPTAPVRTLWLPKHGSTPNQYEDAFALDVADRDGVVRAAAVADGATETVFAKTWAGVLARHLATSLVTPDAFVQMLPALRKAWRADIEDALARAPWYLAEKAEDGAGATLLGLRVLPDGTWRALALGDACLFHVRTRGEEAKAAGTVTAWPLDDPAAFDDRPALLMSRADAPAPPPLEIGGMWLPGDTFLLATDALAVFLLATGRASEAAVWTADRFADIVTDGRRTGAMRNDDVTLVVLPATE